MSLHPFVFMSITNCTTPHMSITGLQTFLDVLFWQIQ